MTTIQQVKSRFLLRILTATFFLILLFILINKGEDGKIQMIPDDHRAIQKEVLRYIPIGTSVTSARRTMNANEFSCSSTFDRMSCEKEQGSFIGFGGTSWVVELQVQKGKVENVQVWIQPAD